MHEEAHQAALLHDCLGLHPPQIQGIITEQVKQHVILCCGDWNFQNVADEIWHHSSTAATLRIEMCDIRNRHIKREIQGIVPILIPVQHRSPEASCAIGLTISVNPLSTPQEFLLISKEMAVVIEVLNIYLE